MSKAIAGAAMLAGAGTIFALMTLATGGLGAAVNTVLFLHLMEGLAAGGLSMEAGAIADALTSNRGQNITTRMAAGMRQIVYGMQRIGATTIYQSTTGAGGSGGNYIYNYVDVVASHDIDAFINLYLDGRQVYWSQTANHQGLHANIGCGTVAVPPSIAVTIVGGAITRIVATGGSGYANVKPMDGYRVRITGGGGSGAVAWAYNSNTPAAPAWTVVMKSGGSGYTSQPEIDVQGAYTFGGYAANDEQDPTQPGYGLGYGIGPDGQHYSFSGKVYCEVRFGDQQPGDVMTSLTNNDGNWSGSGGKTPWVGGCAYAYVNVGYDTDNFPAAPEKRWTISGKNDIYDPRTGLTGYSCNWALQAADVIADSVWGLGDGPIQAWPLAALDQLIAAANVCNENRMTSQGEEAWFTQHIHYDSSTSPGDALAMMMPSAGGRIRRIGGGWMIFPAYWQGPSFTMDQAALVGPVQWTPNRSFKDLINRVNGTYIAPNFPYSTKVTGGVPGQLYDANGWYYGTIDDVWPFAFQPTNFPQYAQDTLHGFAADEWLTQDGGTVLPKELTLRGVLSIVQAQYVAKVELMRNRFQGSGTFPMQLAAWAMQSLDVMEFSMPALGWSDKVLEVDDPRFIVDEQKQHGESGEEGAPVMAISASFSVQETDPSIYEWSETEELTPYDVPAAPSQIPYTPAPPTTFSVVSSAATAYIGADGVALPRALLSWNAPLDITVKSIKIQYQLLGSSIWIDAGTVDVALFDTLVGPLVGGQTYNFQIRSVRANGSFSIWVQALGLVASLTFSSALGNSVWVAPIGTLQYNGFDVLVSPFTATFGGVSVPCAPPPGPVTYWVVPYPTPDLLYFVYYVDPTFAGGDITPIVTLNAGDFVGKAGYYLIGSILTIPVHPRIV